MKDNALMPRLAVGNIDLNNPEIVSILHSAIQRILLRQQSYYRIEAKGCSFKLENYRFPGKWRHDEVLCPAGGWYIIFSENYPLYVGQAQVLLHRLSGAGGTDNFANKNKKSDDERNFIKQFRKLGILGELHVCLVHCGELQEELGQSYIINERDFNNIEKFINVFRSSFQYVEV